MYTYIYTIVHGYLYTDVRIYIYIYIIRHASMENILARPLSHLDLFQGSFWPLCFDPFQEQNRQNETTLVSKLNPFSLAP